MKNKKKSEIKKISKKYNLDQSVASIVLNRIKDTKDLEKYLNPELEYLYSPYEFEDMKKAVDIIQTYIKKSKKIVVYGDYDVDGITGTSVLIKVLKDLNAEIDWIIPNRIDHGYGLNKKLLEDRIDDFDLLITVDCGITAIKEVQYLKKKNKKVIITDHHMPGDELPKADAILNPKLGHYKYKNLAGVGVAYKLCCALADSKLEHLLDIVATGTVADIVPLLDENRIIVKNGLENIHNRVLKEIIKKSGLSLKNIKPANISFVVGPRINSMGRLSDANKLVELFVDQDRKEIKSWVENIEDKNTKRKEIEENIYKEAVKKVNKMDLENTYILILEKKEWHPGVIGIVASRLTEKYHRPVLMISTQDNGVCKGSGRSVDDINLYRITREYEDLFTKLGGHHQAIGFSIREENINKLRDKMNKKIKKDIDKYHLIPKIKIDSKIDNTKISKKLIDDVKKLAPFGYKNPKPLYKLDSVNIDDLRIVGNNHLKFKFYSKDKKIDAIGFNKGDYINYISKNIDLVGYLEIDKYNGRRKLQVKIKDLRNHIKEMANIERKNFVHVYNLIKKHKTISREELFNKSSSSKLYIDFIIKVFEELEIIYRLDNYVFVNENCRPDISFEESKVYNSIVKDDDV